MDFEHHVLFNRGSYKIHVYVLTVLLNFVE